MQRIVEPHAQAVGDEREAGRAFAQQQHINQLLLVGGMRQRHPHLAVLQCHIAGAGRFGRAARAGCLVEDDVAHRRCEGRGTDNFYIRGLAKFFRSSVGQLGDHVHLAGGDCLHQRVRVANGLEDHFVHFWRAREVLLVCAQPHKLALLVLQQLERPAANQRLVFKLHRSSAGCVRLPHMRRQHILEHQLALYVWNDGVQADHHSCVVRRCDAFHGCGVRVHVRVFGVGLVEVVGESHIARSERLPVMKLDAAADFVGVGEPVCAAVH